MTVIKSYWSFSECPFGQMADVGEAQRFGRICRSSPVSGPFGDSPETEIIPALRLHAGRSSHSGDVLKAVNQLVSPLSPYGHLVKGRSRPVT